MSDKNIAEYYTEIAMKNFQCSIFFCNIVFQSSCDFPVSFSAKNVHIVTNNLSNRYPIIPLDQTHPFLKGFSINLIPSFLLQLAYEASETTEGCCQNNKALGKYKVSKKSLERFKFK